MHHSFCKTLHLKSSVICSVNYYVLHQTHSEFWHIQTLFIQVYSDVFKHIQHYEDIFTHIEVFLRYIQAYSGIFSTLRNPRILITLSYSESCYLEPEVYSKPCETLTRYMQNPAVVRTVYPSITQLYSGIFRTPCVTLA